MSDKKNEDNRFELMIAKQQAEIDALKDGLQELAKAKHENEILREQLQSVGGRRRQTVEEASQKADEIIGRHRKLSQSGSYEFDVEFFPGLSRSDGKAFSYARKLRVTTDEPTLRSVYQKIRQIHGNDINPRKLQVFPVGEFDVTDARATPQGKPERRSVAMA